MKPVTAIVITHNESANIARCLGSLAFADEVIVVDSMSTDGTDELARRFPVRFERHAWQGYARQKEYALSLATHDWVLWVDADEEVPAGLAGEIAQLPADAADGYLVPRRTWYLGRWILHAGWYPGYVLRLFRRSRGGFDGRRVHEHFVVQGPVARLKSALLHYPYRDLSHHLQKMDNLTSLAAADMRERGRRVSLPGALARACVRFLGMYGARGGFRDGCAGLAVSALGGMYVFLKYAKLWELNRQGDNRPG